MALAIPEAVMMIGLPAEIIPATVSTVGRKPQAATAACLTCSMSAAGLPVPVVAQPESKNMAVIGATNKAFRILYFLSTVIVFQGNNNLDGDLPTLSICDEFSIDRFITMRAQSAKDRLYFPCVDVFTFDLFISHQCLLFFLSAMVFVTW